jgi:glycosyltransferase involved in cell wall biosynthesis
MGARRIGDTATLRFGALALRPNGAGTSTYIRELLIAMAAENPAASMSALVQADAVDAIPAPVDPIVRPTSAGTRRALHGLVPVRDVQLFHGLDVDVPLWGPGKAVSTVHDLSFFDAPWAYGSYRLHGERLLLRNAVRRADALIAVSEFTAERLAHWFDREATVIPLAPPTWARVPTEEEAQMIRSRYRLPERFLLHVATMEPRKDVALVAEVASQLNLPLVLAGERTTESTGASGTISLGFVPRSDLPALFASATVVCYSSRYEGFGLPPVEAMACGGVVVASKVGALPQVCGNGAILVTRHDPESWLAAIRPLVHDASARAQLRRGAAAATTALSWRSVARQTLEVYRSLGFTV